MKKKQLWFVSMFAIFFIILSGCSSNKKSEAKEDNSLLQPGTVWKEEVGGLVNNLKIIDDTTWEYSESVWHPDPVQISVKRQKGYLDNRLKNMAKNRNADKLWKNALNLFKQ